jgi:MFS transporter, MHS family, shikimate and dehydroshikimate transport protein
MSIAEQVSLAESSVHKTTEIKRIVASSLIGTAVEWYDFLIYGTASALVFNKLFFPLSDPALGTIAAFGTYGVGYLARPLGAAIFGHFGDRVGRKAMLAMTIVIMGLGTFLIGLLPTYDQIGIAAPVLLVLLRLFQGIGLGGEWGGGSFMNPQCRAKRSTLSIFGYEVIGKRSQNYNGNDGKNCSNQCVRHVHLLMEDIGGTKTRPG